MTFPANESQLPHPEQIDPATTTSFPGVPVKGEIFAIDYDIEGPDVGYRWFERSRQRPLFPFGFGLSYTTFSYHDLSLQLDQWIPEVTFTVCNEGKLAGSDVPQLYLRPVSGDFPARLAAFQHITLQPGERMTITLKAEPRIIACWDTDQQHWNIAAGEYQLSVAADACTPQLTGNVFLTARRFGYAVS